MSAWRDCRPDPERTAGAPSCLEPLAGPGGATLHFALLKEVRVYSTIQRLGIRESVVREAPPLVGALVLAELFFKFHSFSLECLAFLATWTSLGWVYSRVMGRR